MDYRIEPTHIRSLATVLRRVACALILAGVVTAPFGCVAHAQDVFVEVEREPAHYDDGPHVRYHGDDVYFVDGRWYARRGHRWVYYREEPRELVRYRHEYRAPRAHHHHEHERVIEVR